MDISLFDYNLPKRLIAQEPCKKRDESRLMIYNRKRRSIIHTNFKDIINHIPLENKFFRNNVSVLKAKLYGKRPNGSIIECLLLSPFDENQTFWCFLKPGKKSLKSKYFSDDMNYKAEILGSNNSGHYKVRFYTKKNEPITEIAYKYGKMPLPPYIKRKIVDKRDLIDSTRYQTVYADKNSINAIASPTAGLHFTNELINKLKKNGNDFFDLSLDIGIGTFQSIGSKNIKDHKIHSEKYRMNFTTYKELITDSKKLRIAIGTTSVRTIESVLRKRKDLEIKKNSIEYETDLYIYPPFNFIGVDALITNFHLPKSSLLCLVSAFLSPKKTDGIDILKKIYNEAINKEYRFFSYGDSLLIV